MYILDQFWQGAVTPGEQAYVPMRQYEPFLRAKERCEKVLQAELSETGRKALEERTQAEDHICALGLCDNFIDGFRLGALMMLDVLSTPPQRQGTPL